MACEKCDAGGYGGACICAAIPDAPRRHGQRQAEYTPGPWEWRDFGDDWCLISRTPRVPVVLAGNDYGRITTRDEHGILQPITPDHPNARLIAAAPDLLAVLQALIGHMPVRNVLAPRESLGSLLAAAETAINKALGKEQPR